MSEQLVTWIKPNVSEGEVVLELTETQLSDLLGWYSLATLERWVQEYADDVNLALNEYYHDAYKEAYAGYGIGAAPAPINVMLQAPDEVIETESVTHRDSDGLVEKIIRTSRRKDKDA